MTQVTNFQYKNRFLNWFINIQTHFKSTFLNFRKRIEKKQETNQQTENFKLSENRKRTKNMRKRIG